MGTNEEGPKVTELTKKDLFVMGFILLMFISAIAITYAATIEYTKEKSDFYQAQFEQCKKMYYGRSSSGFEYWLGNSTSQG